MTFLEFLLLLLTLIISTICIRHVLWHLRPSSSSKPSSLMIILGSGGHTREMINLVDALSPKFYSPRIYISSKTDSLSSTKAIELENGRKCLDFKLLTIPRAREVGQSWISSIFSTSKSFLYCILLVLQHRPDVILCNGPGVCVPICLTAWIMRILTIFRTKLIFVESLCRVKTLSLTGKILLYFVDEFVVQWESLADIIGRHRVKYIGRIS